MEGQDLTAVILAGGRGTRVRALYPDVPKPLIPVASEAFLYWVTAWYANQGVSDFVYSAGHLGNQVEHWVRQRPMPPLVRQVRIENEPLGTGGGLLNCLDLCRDWVLVANGDSLCLANLSAFLALHQRPGLDGAILGVDVDDASRYGTLDVDIDGRLKAFREKQPGTGTVNSGTYLFRRTTLERLRQPGSFSIEHDLVPEILASGGDFRVQRVTVVEFIDIGIPETVVTASDFIARNRARFDWS